MHHLLDYAKEWASRPDVPPATYGSVFNANALILLLESYVGERTDIKAEDARNTPRLESVFNTPGIVPPLKH